MKKSPKMVSTAKKTVNPFEVHINKQKMTVLGQKVKNDRGFPGVSRAKAIKKRKETLFQEYKLQNKSNIFTDRRIGERNKNMSSEDKAVARFTAVRLKGHKKSIFNLADDEILTHKGQTLVEIEKFDDPRSDDDDDDDGIDNNRSGKLDSKFVEDAHFGGGLLKRTGKEGAKTHKELIDELIAESKKRKVEKQKTKEATLELTEKLDMEWKDLLPLVSKTQKSEEKQNTLTDDYDKVMRELKFEARGTVSDRLKTKEELVEEEREKVEELENQRLQRMKGFNEEISTKVAHRSADDLDDDFVYDSDPEYVLTYSQEGESNVEIDAQLNGKNIGQQELKKCEREEESAEDSTEGDEEEEQEELETASEDNLSDLKGDSSEETDDEEQEIQERGRGQVKSELLKKTEMVEIIREELPYIYLPESYEALQELLENISISEQSITLEHMIKCNHPSLCEKNKEKLGVLFTYLLQYLNNYGTKMSVKNSFELFTVLAPKLFELAQLNKENAYSSIREIIKKKHEKFKKHPKTYPDTDVLFFLKLIGLLFPTSDFRHPVVTPCYVFIEQMLNKCKIRNGKDIAYGLFLVTLVLEYTTLSRRFLPAAVNYLGGILHMAIPKVGVKLIKVNPPFKATATDLVLVENCANKINVELKMELSDLTEKEIKENFKIRATYTTLKLVEAFRDLLESQPSSVEIFRPIFIYLEFLPMRNYPKDVYKQYEDLSHKLRKQQIERNLNYIVMEAKRPKALRLYEPKIEEVFDGKRRKIQSREKAEREKLVYKLKKETKGALREIRRDKSFLGRVKIQQRIQVDSERKNKVNRIFSEAAAQQSELKSLERKRKQ